MMEKITHLSNFGIDERYLAHTPNESLIEHSNLTLEYLYKILKFKNLENLMDELLKKIEIQNFELLKKMFVDAIYLHDIGKTNPYFQAKKMNNEYFSEYKNETQSSDHSFLSSQHYIDYYLKTIDKITNRAIKEKFKFLLYSFSYHQAKHHGALGEFEAYRKIETNSKTYWQYLERFSIPHSEFYILNKLLRIIYLSIKV
ncbi:MAG: hypothetical protein KN64_03000 [Sulfurovum sp. AS07-7]|nr:MAG: hypothetical protein KN64_03000 [Sulfurovum sp. AS07-7]